MTKRSARHGGRKPAGPDSADDVPAPAGSADSTKAQQSRQVVRFPLRFGWWSLLVYLSIGLALEVLHGFKAEMYLSPQMEVRRLMWTLGHAHGTLLALVHLGLAATAGLQFCGHLPRMVSTALAGASILLPGGFLLGGWYTRDGDPGVGILLVPVGAVLLVLAVLRISLAVTRSTSAQNG